MNKVEVFLLDKAATVPTRNHSGDAGLDLYALETTMIRLGETSIVKTGVAVKVPEGYVGLVRERSSIGKKGLKVAGGVIDAGYSGDISVLLMNISNKDEGWDFPYYCVKAGERIAQLILIPISTPEPIVVDELWESNRGDKAFGSSGK